MNDHPPPSALRRALVSSGLLWPLTPVRANNERISFGIVPYLPVRRLISLYAPLTPVLEAAFGKPVDIVCGQDYRQHLQMLRARKFDIVADSLFMGRIAHKELGHLPLTRTAAGLEPVIVTPVQSNLKQLRELEGKTLVLTDRISALGVVGLRYLRDQSLEPDKKVPLLLSGSHSNSLHLMLAGQAAAALVSKTTLTQVDPQLAAKVRVLATPPTALAAVVYHLHPSHKALQGKISQAMMQFANGTPAGKTFIDTLGHKGLLELHNKDLISLDPMVTEFYRQLAAT